MANKSGIAVAGVGIGCVFAMSGLRGWGISATLQDLLTGKNPSSQPLVNQITNPSSTNPNAGDYASASNSAVASDALEYNGGAYGWGKSGPPGTPVDCSGMANYIIGKMLGLSVPGAAKGNYSGHGPVTGQWYVWTGCTTVPQSQMQAGMLVCWPTHMAVAISNTEVISALNPELGVQVTTVAGANPGTGPTKVRAINQVYSASPSEPTSQKLADVLAHVGVR
jgi:cell wall-associated NlpC family hydrolase